MLAVLELGIVLFALVLGTICFGSVKLGEVAFVIVKSLGVLMDNIGRDSIKEGSVVRSGQVISAFALV